MKIGIAGAGGIGSNVALNLVRSGVKQFKIVDFDRIEKSNLNRQFYFEDQIGNHKVHMLKRNLERIDHTIRIEIEVLKLDRTNIYETFKDCGIIVEGFDCAEYKKILLEEFAGSGKQLVSASGIAGNQLDNIKVKNIGNCTIAGDFVSDFRDHKIYSPKVLMVASIMSNIILEKGGFFE